MSSVRIPAAWIAVWVLVASHGSSAQASSVSFSCSGKGEGVKPEACLRNATQEFRAAGCVLGPEEPQCTPSTEGNTLECESPSSNCADPSDLTEDQEHGRVTCSDPGYVLRKLRFSKDFTKPGDKWLRPLCLRDPVAACNPASARKFTAMNLVVGSGPKGRAYLRSRPARDKSDASRRGSYVARGDWVLTAPAASEGSGDTGSVCAVSRPPGKASIVGWLRTTELAPLPGSGEPLSKEAREVLDSLPPKPWPEQLVRGGSPSGMLLMLSEAPSSPARLVLRAGGTTRESARGSRISLENRRATYQDAADDACSYNLYLLNRAVFLVANGECSMEADDPTGLYLPVNRRNP